MPKVIALRGLPGSGKSSYARANCGMLSDVVRVNRDDLRKSLFDQEGVLTFDREEFITKVQRDIAAQALNTGKSVIVDDTNLRQKYLRAWNEFALEHGADFEVHTISTTVEECVRRDSARERTVGEAVIRDLARKFTRNGEFQPYVPLRVPDPTEPLEWDHDLYDCILVDVDGTVAINNGHRGWFEWDKVEGDDPNEPVIDIVRQAINAGECVIFMSGRDEVCRGETTRWLNKHVHLGWHRLYMRPEGDTRRDDIVKRELFDAHIRGKYNVKFILDDRNQVVRMWRSLGIPTLQVAEGNF